MIHKFNYRWKLADGYPASGIEYHGKKVFGTFVCGGGSTMGYKLAGYDHIGGVEIDKAVAGLYSANHKPRYLYNEDIRQFVRRETFPPELLDIDILDGSPPCSSFSISGSRENGWGKKKIFREGQANQVLDDLFFEYIALAKRLQPKIVIAENVRGLLVGNAKAYVKKIYDNFDDAGYKVQIFLLNAASMGVPQKRERVFFVCQRKDLGLNKLVLNFSEKPIVFGEFRSSVSTETPTLLAAELMKHRVKSDKNLADINMRLYKKNTRFNEVIIRDTEVCNTIMANASVYRDFDGMKCSDSDYIFACTFPIDYNFGNQKVEYIVGMSVPPVMMAQLSHQIYSQWLSKI